MFIYEDKINIKYALVFVVYFCIGLRPVSKA